MKQKLIIFTVSLALMFGSLINLPAERITHETSSDTLQTTLPVRKKQNIYVKDKSLYDQTFLDGIASYWETLRIENNHIIISTDTTLFSGTDSGTVARTDTAYFPEEPTLDSATTYTGTRGSNRFVLTVTRTNLTNMTYNFQIIDKDNMSIVNRSGVAILSSYFFLGSEIDDDDQFEDAYGSSEYWDDTKDCTLSVRIGERDGNGKQRARVHLHCRDISKRSWDLDDCPTLRTE